MRANVACWRLPSGPVLLAFKTSEDMFLYKMANPYGKTKKEVLLPSYASHRCFVCFRLAPLPRSLSLSLPPSFSLPPSLTLALPLCLCLSLCLNLNICLCLCLCLCFCLCACLCSCLCLSGSVSASVSVPPSLSLALSLQGPCKVSQCLRDGFAVWCNCNRSLRGHPCKGFEGSLSGVLKGGYLAAMSRAPEFLRYSHGELLSSARVPSECGASWSARIP